ncbi:MAG: hypothetical protein K1X78_23875 [Verrucomicrobiaceae bacterium]|nr:hypothetical protein [Verrucomicrobiaceae bacterium]
MPTFEPVPKNLREQMTKRLASMSDQDVAALYELWLLKEKLDVRQQMSDQAEQEMAAGTWDRLPEIIREYRSRQKSA